METVPALHKNRRGPHSRVTATAVGYVLRWSGGSVYFAGDTDLFEGMAALAPVDVALLPIWGWGPTSTCPPAARSPGHDRGQAGDPAVAHDEEENHA